MSEPVQNDQASAAASGNLRKSYWDARFVLTIAFMGLLALIAAYLEYVYYPSLLLSNQFAETNVSLHLSFLTFQFDATRGTELVPGIPSLDFFQVLLVSIILLNISHFIERRRRK